MQIELMFARTNEKKRTDQPALDAQALFQLALCLLCRRNRGTWK